MGLADPAAAPIANAELPAQENISVLSPEPLPESFPWLHLALEPWTKGPAADVNIPEVV